ncbi:MAG: hypothetical protein ACR2PG_19625 [Hyphomicrobiaceae bacterium]
MRSMLGCFVVLSVTASVLGGCASDGSNLLTTSSLPDQKRIAAAKSACLALQTKITSLRQEGTVGRVEKAATGKSKTVVIKRASLGKVAELNQAHADFQARCSKHAVQKASNAAAGVIGAQQGPTKRPQ